MSYDPAEPTVRDQIRGRVLDTSNDPASEYLIDATYDSILGRHVSWLRAGAEVAGRIYALIAGRPVALGSDGDSIRWSDQRALAIMAAQEQFLAEAETASADAAFGSVLTVEHDVMTDGCGDTEVRWW